MNLQEQIAYIAQRQEDARRFSAEMRATSVKDDQSRFRPCRFSSPDFSAAEPVSLLVWPSEADRRVIAPAKKDRTRRNSHIIRPEEYFPSQQRTR